MSALLALVLLGGNVDDIERQVGLEPHEQTVARVEAFAAAHPGTEETARLLLLAAQLRRTDGQPDLSRALLTRVLADNPGSQWALDAQLMLADLDLGARNYDAAIAGYQQLAQTSTGRWQYQGQRGVELAREARLRLGWTLGLACGLVLLAVWRMVRGWRAHSLWPLPEEAKVGLPISALLALVSLGQPPDEAHAVLTIAFGSAVLVWANAAHFVASPPVGARRFLEAGLAVFQAAALLLVAVVVNGLWPRFVETLASGAE